MRISIHFNLCVLLAVSFAAPDVSAQLTSLTSGLDLKQEDLELMKEAARERLTDQDVGTELTWQNEKSGHSGTVTLNRRYDRDGMDCRIVTHEIFSKKLADPIGITNNICKQASGEWKIYTD